MTNFLIDENLENLINGHEALIEMTIELNSYIKKHGKNEKTDKTLDRIKRIASALNAAYLLKAKAEYHAQKRREADIRYLQLVDKLKEYETASSL